MIDLNKIYIKEPQVMINYFGDYLVNDDGCEDVYAFYKEVEGLIYVKRNNRKRQRIEIECYKKEYFKEYFISLNDFIDNQEIEYIGQNGVKLDFSKSYIELYEDLSKSVWLYIYKSLFHILKYNIKENYLDLEYDKELSLFLFDRKTYTDEYESKDSIVRLMTGVKNEKKYTK